MPVHHIEKELYQIVNSSPSKSQHPVGALTAEHRNTWYHARERLMKGIYAYSILLANHGSITDPVNKNSLDVIERAQCVFCLDPSLPGMVTHSSDERAMSIASSRNFHGNGTADSSCNRWFDHGLHVSNNLDSITDL